MTTQSRTDRKRASRRPKTLETLDRLPPFNLEAEVGVLGSLMLLPETCDEIVNLIRAEDFYDEAHRKLFHHIMEMHGAGKKIDMLFLRERLIAEGDYESVGGAAGLAEIFTSVPHAAHVTYYANIVRSKATSRNLDHNLFGIACPTPTDRKATRTRC